MSHRRTRVAVSLLLALTFAAMFSAPHAASAATGPDPVNLPGSGGSIPTVITSYVVTCSSLTVTGTTDPANGYVHGSIAVLSGDDTWYPASAGTFSFTYTFPSTLPVGSYLSFLVVGAPTNALYSQDNNAYQQVQSVSCPSSWPASAAALLPPDVIRYPDGRLNRQDEATAVLWCTADHGIVAYTPQGSVILFKVTAKQIKDALTEATNPEALHNVLIAQNWGQQLWALQSNELMLLSRTKQPYHFVAPGDVCGAAS